MSQVTSDLEWALRLSGQLETLSQLAETLTYKVLELEERVAANDLQLTALRQASEEFTTGLGQTLESRMLETEERLWRMEDLLQASRPSALATRPLRALPRQSSKHDLPAPLTEADPLEDGFLDQLPEEEDFQEEVVFAEDSSFEAAAPFEEDPPFLEDLLDESLAS
jgi:hypothetical protein